MAAKLPLHLGLTPWNFTQLDASSLCSQAQFAEQCGYQSLWLPENHFGEQALPDPLTLLASVAGVTSTIKLATTSYLLTLRNPLQAAEQVAVLDQLCGGRLILGVGRGYAPEMLRAFHVPPKEKRRIFAWTLELMRAAWAGQPESLDGDAEHAVSVYPRPLQQPHPPVWIAAFGPKALTQAGTFGLPYLSSPMESLQTLLANYDTHRTACAAAALSPPAEVPVMRTVFVSRDPHQLRTLREKVVAVTDNSRLQDGETLDDWAIIGEPNEVYDRLASYVEQLGMTHLISTRLRVKGLHAEVAQASVALLAEVLSPS